jgi:hypothetical protein
MKETQILMMINYCMRWSFLGFTPTIGIRHVPVLFTSITYATILIMHMYVYCDLWCTLQQLNFSVLAS